MEIHNSIAAFDVIFCATYTEADWRCMFMQICSKSFFSCHLSSEYQGLYILYVSPKGFFFTRIFLRSIETEVEQSHDSTQYWKIQYHKSKCMHMHCVCVPVLYNYISASNIFVPDYIVYTEIHSACVGTCKTEKIFLMSETIKKKMT